ncbi:MAG: hypothetical protein QNJ37_19170 [Crocosphaera sp.]|nr:hypothetical protein [Crocosphaera sp.]
MNSKAVQLLVTLGLVTTLGACGGGGTDTTAPTDSAPAGETTEEPTDAEPKATEGVEGGEGGEGGEGDEGGEGGEG